MKDSRSGLLNRRQMIGLLGVSAGVGFFSGADRAASLLAAPFQGSSGGSPVTFPKGAIIRTILKDIPPESINGSILFHEHLNGEYNRESRQLKLPPPSQADTAPVIEDIKEAMKKNGVVLIVDGGHPDMGTNYDALRTISQATGLHVVCSGGYYIQNTYPQEVTDLSEDQLADSLVTEAAKGRYGAYGEIGDNPNETDFTPDEKKVYRAVGKAHLKNNLPIFTHNNYGPENIPRDIALRQLDVYESVGVKPSSIAIGHMDSLPGSNADMIKALAKRGAWVGIDRIRGEEKGDENRVKLIVQFLEAGYINQLLLSSDTRKDYGKVARFTTQLKAAGVKAADLQTIQVDNPRRFLAFVPQT
jgi:predicted metal-dependent phosphotriesterase family hydrolase